MGDYDGNQNPHFEVYGNTVTVGGITGTGGAIENTEYETGIGNGTLVINNTVNCTLAGVIIRNGGVSGTLALVKSGSGSLTITGSYCGHYTGGLTVNAGTLDYSGGTLPNCNYTITGGTLNIGGQTPSIKTFQITGGTVSGTGTLTSNAAYDVQAGTDRRQVGRRRNRLEQDRRRNGHPRRQQHLHRHDHHHCRHAAARRQRHYRLFGEQQRHRHRRGRDVRRQSLQRDLPSSNAISGTGRLVKDGGGALTLSGGNSAFSGTVVVNSGTLSFNSTSAIPAANYSITGGTCEHRHTIQSRSAHSKSPAARSPARVACSPATPTTTCKPAWSARSSAAEVRSI